MKKKSDNLWGDFLTHTVEWETRVIYHQYR